MSKVTRFEKFSWIIATVFGAGNIPEWLSCRYPGWFWWVRPGAGAGTIASLLTLLVLQIPMVLLGIGLYGAVTASMVAFAIGLVIVGPADSYIRKTEGRQLRHDGVETDHDFNKNCWDEVVGQLVAGIPVFWLYDMLESWPEHDHMSFSTMLMLLVDAFVVFRIFDITKWLGIRWIEKSLGKNALGILWDDVAAAIYAWFAVGLAVGYMYTFDSHVCLSILIVSAVMLIFVFWIGAILKDELADTEARR